MEGYCAPESHSGRACETNSGTTTKQRPGSSATNSAGYLNQSLVNSGHVASKAGDIMDATVARLDVKRTLKPRERRCPVRLRQSAKKTTEEVEDEVLESAVIMS